MVVSRLQPGMTVFVPGVSGESQAFFAALARNPAKADGVRFVGVHFPQLNHNDYAGLHSAARLRAYFMQPELREPFRQGRVELVPADYLGVLRDLARLEVDIAIAQVSPPDAAGDMSLGLAYDFLPVVWTRAHFRVAHVNPELPATRGSFRVAAGDCDLICEEDSPLIEYDSGEPSDALLRLGRNAASVIRDGDTIQLGIGRYQRALLAALEGHRRLRMHSGLVTADVLPLVDRGVIAGVAAIEAGVALGDRAFYRRLAQDPTFYFRPASATHDVRRIAAIPDFVALNAAIEIDLFGQVNTESLGAQLVAGVGGMPAFVQGAQLAENGRAVFCITATADKGRVSRIVPRLADRFVALPRHAADIVATEFGIARLEGLSVDERAARLIELAAPQFRAALAGQWQEIRSAL